VSQPTHKIQLLGMDQHGLSRESQERLALCGCLFSSARLLPKPGQFNGEINPITPLAEALTAIQERLTRMDVAILASGDPLFFGIGSTLLKKFPREQIEILPALSSMQLAFSRCKIPWQDAKFISLHGRQQDKICHRIIGHPKVFLLTDPALPPNLIASQLINLGIELDMEQSLESTQIFVAENLGMDSERLTQGSLSEIASQSFDSLNVMIILQEERQERSCSLGLREREIKHSRGLITKDEVRAITLHRLSLPKHGVFWDIGAGSGSIAIEAAGLSPGLEIHTIERHRQELANISANRKAFQAYNIQIHNGHAPEALADLPRPNRVFIGGSGGQLAEIIRHLAAIMLPGSRVVINAVIASTREQAPALLHQHGFRVEISEVRVKRFSYPDDSDLKQMNPISIICGVR